MHYMRNEIHVKSVLLSRGENSAKMRGGDPVGLQWIVNPKMILPDSDLTDYPICPVFHCVSHIPIPF